MRLNHRQVQLPQVDDLLVKIVLLTIPMLRRLSSKAQGCKDLWKNI